jgi:hypothetical protein
MKTENFLKDYIRHLSEEDLRFASGRLQRLCGDTAELLEFLSRNSELDKWLKTATNSVEFFLLVDQLEFVIKSENDKRNQLADKKEEKKRRVKTTTVVSE